MILQPPDKIPGGRIITMYTVIIYNYFIFILLLNKSEAQFHNNMNFKFVSPFFVK